MAAPSNCCCLTLIKTQPHTCHYPAATPLLPCCYLLLPHHYLLLPCCHHLLAHVHTNQMHGSTPCPFAAATAISSSLTPLLLLCHPIMPYTSLPPQMEQAHHNCPQPMDHGCQFTQDSHRQTLWSASPRFTSTRGLHPICRYSKERSPHQCSQSHEGKQ